MKDLHSHYLPVDDGSHNIEMSKKMLDIAKQYNVKDIMFTPHYIPDSKYISNVSANKKIFNVLKEYADSLGINIYLGNEVYFNYEILSLLKEKQISTLNNSKYMLIEIPLYDKVSNARSVFHELIINGIVPILAHPERYSAYYNDMDFFFELREMGVLMQLNFPSLFGEYGAKAKKMAKKLLKANLISFVGSDVHRPSSSRFQNVAKLEKKLTKLVHEEKVYDILEGNFIKIVNNEDVD